MASAHWANNLNANTNPSNLRAQALPLWMHPPFVMTPPGVVSGKPNVEIRLLLYLFRLESWGKSLPLNLSYCVYSNEKNLPDFYRLACK